MSLLPLLPPPFSSFRIIPLVPLQHRRRRSITGDATITPRDTRPFQATTADRPGPSPALHRTTSHSRAATTPPASLT
ncbi:hypothetical protein Pmani_033118 [Petrolisthes manimaculis]|uniref:Uncharacterized protein n=1 Tax=Petrolisthes manimaculis TaxID=1843537 RepID=A0AAE1TQD8_9EUCA|nr:hypothetical protein Pmani_033118 [Petrolisthes manimaculis]